MEKIYDMVIIGGGPGGYTAALYAARAGLSSVVLERLSAGGQMALTHQIDNYPGFPEGIDGFELSERMKAQAERFGTESRYAEVYSMDLNAEPKMIETSEGLFYGKTVVISTGADPRQLCVAGEKELTGRGVSYCASCDGMFYRGQTVVIVGGGDSAVAEAIILSRIAEKVVIVHRRDELRAAKVYHEQIINTPNIEIRWNSTVKEFISDEFAGVTGVKLQDTVTGEISELKCQGVFVSIGREPVTKLLGGQLELDANGYIVAGESTATNIPGVYAVGDVRTKSLRQIVTAVADGAMAVHMAEDYLVRKK